MRSSLALLALSCVSVCFAQSPFEPPQAKVWVEPARTFDLLNIDVTIDVDYAGRTIKGVAVNTLAPLSNGLKQITLHAGPKLEILSVTIDGKPAKFARDGQNLNVTVPSTVKGKASKVAIKYQAIRKTGGGFGSEGGWHWIEPRAGDPYHIGFWTQGETEYNRNWAPTWDYPNDFATSRTTTTVPKEWDVIGNGLMTANVVKGAKRTVTWTMKQPHATYLISLCAGPFDIKKDKWQDRELWYVVPKGKGNLIDGSFGDTKDMLTFFSNRFGFTYAWPKYAQNAMYDFGGGMENVSSTTLGEGALSDPRSGFYNMSGLNAHELGHQWFGDTVTCRDWGHIWLNESFATFVQALYFEHARGYNEYIRQINGDMQGYAQEALRYQRPVITNMYPNPDSMFDSHTYPKGASILHTIRRTLGDQAFFAGIKLYLNRHKHTPVTSPQLAKAFLDASGVDVQPLFDQWLLKPGHPALEYDWSFANGKITVNVKQTHNTSKGAPIYVIPTEVGAIIGDKLVRLPVTLNAASQSFELAVDAEPSAVLLDPDLDFLRIMKHTFAPKEALPIVLYGSSPVDRQDAFNVLCANNPTNADLLDVVAMLEKDKDRFPAIMDLSALANLKREPLRAFWRAELNHACEQRRGNAVRALSMLTPNDEDATRIRGMINAKEYYSVVEAAINTLDPIKDKQLLKSALVIPAWRNRIRDAALIRMAGRDADDVRRAVSAAVKTAAAKTSDFEGNGSVRAMTMLPYGPDLKAPLLAVLRSKQWDMVQIVVAWAGQSKDADLIPDLKAAATGAPDWLKGPINAAVAGIEKQ